MYTMQGQSTPEILILEIVSEKSKPGICMMGGGGASITSSLTPAQTCKVCVSRISHNAGSRPWSLECRQNGASVSAYPSQTVTGCLPFRSSAQDYEWNLYLYIHTCPVTKVLSKIFGSDGISADISSQTLISQTGIHFSEFCVVILFYFILFY